MNLNIYQETNPVAVGNVLVGAIYKNSAPSVLVGTPVTYTGPYTGQTQLATFPSLLPILYIYICWESSDGTPSGTVRNRFVVQPSVNAYAVRDNLELIAGVSSNMLAGTPTYGPDATLPTWNWYLEQVGNGTLNVGVDYVKTIAGVATTNDDINADGWQLSGGAVFSDDQLFVIHFYPQALVQSAATPASLFNAIYRVTTSQNILNTQVGGAILLQGVSTYLQVTLPALSTVADGVPIFFTSSGGNHLNAGIFCSGTDLIQAARFTSDWSTNQALTHLYLGQSEQIAFYKYTRPDSGVPFWMVLFDDSGYKNVGELVLSYSKQGINTLFLNGATLSRANYPRLWEWINTLESGILIPGSAYAASLNNQGANKLTYNINMGYFSTGNGSSTFQVPTMYEYGFMRFVDGSARFPGSFEFTVIESHAHTMHGKGTFADNASSPNPNWYLSRLNGAYAGSGGNLFGRVQSTAGPDQSLRTGSDNSIGGNIQAVGNQFETRPNNIGVYALIRF